MNTDLLLDELASLLEVPRDTLLPDVELDRFETWDSLTKVSLIGVCQDRYDFAADGAMFDHVRTVGELLDVVQGAVGADGPDAP
ncbi:phosphopantetheine-binding protein [Paraburkholderia diazotrophica]|uniref:Acyl carrier protein n=1 Tax=Paraburkholderia diazotrophica TaxID=667676 RepID=A0A1H7DNU4_9BURK|nr:phosphopantetheine-binding protein [Paraburkholderia diazotrophica]SEK00930.1 acyl carrier protein [Paraburkholderia diazotrophica]